MDIKELFKPYKGDEPYMFVSYNHDDSELVYDIISDLHSRGYRIWHDNGIPTGVNYVETLARKIKNCEVFLCFMSSEYIVSDYCKQEMHYAFSNHRKVVPIMLDNVTLPDEIAFRFAAINWTRLSRFDSEKELVDQLCEMDKEIFAPCYSGEIMTPPPPPVLTIGEKLAQWIKEHKVLSALILTAVVLALAVGIWLAVGRKGNGETGGASSSGQAAGSAANTLSQSEKETAAADTPSQSEKETAVADAPSQSGKETVAADAPSQSEKETAAADAPSQSGKETAAVDAPTQSEKVLTEPAAKEELLASGKKAADDLSARVQEECPLSVYDPKGSAEEETAWVYDNAVAAMALVDGSSVYKNHTEKDAAGILDQLAQLTKNGSITVPSTDTKDMAAAAIAFLRYDRHASSFSYVRCAQILMDYVMDSCTDEDGGFDENASSGYRSTAGNIWLYGAFDMLGKKTGNSVYADCARSAQQFVQSMRSADGSWYLPGKTASAAEGQEKADAQAGQEGEGPVSTQVQALAAMVMNDRTGIAKAQETCVKDGGFAPDNAGGEGFSSECTALMALACADTGTDDLSDRLLSTLYGYQLSNGSIPETDAATWTDSSGTIYKEIPRTAATAWYAMAAAGVNPFRE